MVPQCAARGKFDGRQIYANWQFRRPNSTFPPKTFFRWLSKVAVRSHQVRTCVWTFGVAYALLNKRIIFSLTFPVSLPMIGAWSKVLKSSYECHALITLQIFEEIVLKFGQFVPSRSGRTEPASPVLAKFPDKIRCNQSADRPLAFDLAFWRHLSAKVSCLNIKLTLKQENLCRCSSTHIIVPEIVRSAENPARIH